jgi:hypothetical protein
MQDTQARRLKRTQMQNRRARLGPNTQHRKEHVEHGQASKARPSAETHTHTGQASKALLKLRAKQQIQIQ